MAWRFVGMLKELAVSINGGTAEIITNVKMPGIPLADANGILSNGGNVYDSGLEAGNSISTPDAYNKIMGLSDSNLNLISYYTQISTGGYIELWNPSAPNYKIRLTRTRYGSVEVTFYNFSLNTGTRYSHTVYYSSAYPICRLNIGFTLNDDNSLSNVYFVDMWQQVESSSSYNAWFRVHSYSLGDYPQITYPCILGIITGNEIEPLPEGDPNYQGGLNDQSEGGDGNFDDTSDVISEPSAPTITASSSGLVTVYNPTLAQIQSVAQALVNPNIFQALAQSVIKLSDVIIGLSIFPFAITDGGQQEIKINVLGVQLSTGVQCTKAAKQFETVDCGYLDIEPYWGNCLDYSPYTKISIYLPYVGYQELNTDEIMGRRLSLKYRIDLVSGACMAIILVNSSVLYQFSGTCSAQIPISNENYDGLMNSIMSLVSDAKIGEGKSAIEAKSKNKAPKKINNNSELEAFEEHVEGLAEAAVGVVNAIKPSISHAGSVKAAPGFLGVQTPFIIIERPHQCLAENYNNFHGYPCNMYKKLGDLSGYTEVDSIHLNIPDATANEIAECEYLLKGGIVI